jgi:hypothetical protein
LSRLLTNDDVSLRQHDLKMPPYAVVSLVDLALVVF